MHYDSLYSLFIRMGDMQMSLSNHMLSVYEMSEMVLDVAFCEAQFIFVSVNRDLGLQSVQAILCLSKHLFACEETCLSLYILYVLFSMLIFL